MKKRNFLKSICLAAPIAGVLAIFGAKSRTLEVTGAAIRGNNHNKVGYISVGEIYYNVKSPYYKSGCHNWIIMDTATGAPPTLDSNKDFCMQSANDITGEVEGFLQKKGNHVPIEELSTFKGNIRIYYTGKEARFMKFAKVA